jgi:predicted DNA-binding protein with PD1-like motif
MKEFTFFLLLLPLSCGLLYGQGKIPDVHVISTDFERIVIIRMRSGADLLEGLNQAVKNHDIKNGIILTGIGSVTDYHYHVVSNKNLPPAEEYPKASVPMDMTSVQGYVMNGKVHAHITLSDENSMVGGHLEGGTIALTFFVVSIGVLPDNLEMGEFDNYKY